jgi:hypothetical protein
MNIPNNFTNFKSELYKSAIIIELKERVIEHRVLTITQTLEESQDLAREIAHIHDAILIQEQRQPIRPVGSCLFPMIIVQN